MTVEPPEPALTDGVVSLRPWGEEEDVEAVTAACNDRAIAEFLDIIPFPYTEDDARDYIERTRQGWSSGTTSNFAIVVDREAGRLDRRELETARRRGRGGRLLGCARSAWPRRVHEALKLAAHWALQERGMERLQLRADEQNPASRRVAEKAGFTQEGILRSSHFNPRLERRVDFVMYSLLRSEL